MLLREYERVKRQKEEDERARLEARQQEIQLNSRVRLLKGESVVTDYGLHKKWFEDTVFQNQAQEEKPPQTYINDNVRSEFHRKFLQRFIMR